MKREIFLIVCCTLLQGCFPLFSGTPKISGKTLSTESCRLLLSKIPSNQSPETIQALFRMTVTGKRERYTVRQALVYKEGTPPSLRTESLPLNAAYSLSVLTSRDGKALYLDYGNREGAKGDFKDLLARSFLSLSLTEAQLISLFSGLPIATDDSACIQGNDGFLYIIQNDDSLHWQFEPEFLEPVAVRSYGGFSGGLTARVTFEGERHNKAGIFERVKINLPKEDVDVEFILSSVKVNKPLTEQRFNINIPDGFLMHSL